MSEIPKILDISVNTFHNYRQIKAGDTQDIPYEKVVLLEHLFGLNHGELAAGNQPPRQYAICMLKTVLLTIKKQ